jgi:polyphosphate kinase 2
VDIKNDPVTAIDERKKSLKKRYKRELYELQVQLVKLQNHVIRCNDKILVIFEGRDAAGKDGTIKRITQHLSPRETRVVALSKPSDRDLGSWYFQRWVAHLPAAQELVLFNRSWYNRAGVERVMGFCSDAEYEAFMESVVPFEQLLIRSGIKIFKYYLDISRNEQKKRIKDRHQDPLTQWKISPIDEESIKHWEDYSLARNEMFARTHHALAPWTVVRADDKRAARLNIIRDLLIRQHYQGKEDSLLLPDPAVVFTYDVSYLEQGLIAP